ncbi:MAG: HNH endonuclease [Deltaproteobacteria bacterium]|nr:HNH endonuclease [Deltaproteobacteria bacterium]
MRARAIRRGVEPRSDAAGTAVGRSSTAALVFLRGRDADGRLRDLVAERAQARPVLGALAAALLSGRGFEPLGFRCLGDWSRERLGVGARAVREWVRVWRALEELPLLRGAVLSGEVSWTVARLIVGVVSPENEAACLETVRGRTVRAVEALLRAVAPADESPTEGPGEDRVAVRVACSPRVATKWAAALELARRMAGENLSAAECAEAIVAECASAAGGAEALDSMQRRSSLATRRPEEESESGLRAEVWPRLRWNARPSRRSDRLEHLTCGLQDCSSRKLDRRLRAAMAFLQQVDFEIGRILRQVVERKLYRELGFESFERYVQERLDLSPRTARRLVRLARAGHGAPALASAFREGRITLLQAEVLLRGESVEAREKLELALRVTLRRLEDEVLPRRVAFWAPPEVAALFEALVACLGFETMLDHAIATWLEAGAQFDDYADFTRDGFRCTVPACTARRNLQSHHIWFRSACGPDVAWNRTTLCAVHHHRGVHAGSLALRGRAPDGLTYELGVGRFRSGDVRLEVGNGSL